MKAKNQIEVRPHNLKELAHLYKVDVRTFTKWLRPYKDEIGIIVGRVFTVKQVETIFDKLGYPYVVEIGELQKPPKIHLLVN